MGLDVTAYRGLVDCGEVDEEPEDYDGSSLYVSWAVMHWQEAKWPGRAAGLLAGHRYQFAESDHVISYGYGRHSWFRSGLARLVGFLDQQDFWNRAKPDAPFYELLAFADNEGYLGAAVAAELARDFAEWDGRARAQMDGIVYQWYQKWWRGCEVAAQGGCLDFH